ncbi:MAG TPA: hypothetical protein DD618_02945, partial [Acholeplasmatales bacterium]|nr:hypothetical protein [Acholeplasmatales bacterium]
MKKCFTITALRTTQDFQGYQNLLKDGIYSAIEVFFPDSEEDRDVYQKNVLKLLSAFPGLEVIMHLPFGPNNDLCNDEGLLSTIQKMKAGMDFAAKFAVKKLTLHLGYVKKDRPRAEYILRATAIMKDLCDYADGLGMTVMIENMPTE